MKNVFPDYYDDFKCIAGRCRHSCCIGWEIDIDELSLERFKKVEGPLGLKLKDNIVLEDECPHFKLGEKERCPFLDENNLCELILNLGEESLCQICTDHPRFRNYLSDRCETGLGLCCEEAARIILTKKEKAHLIEYDDGKEEESEPFDELILNFRDEAINTLQMRDYKIDTRIDELLEMYDIRIPKKTNKEWADIFLSLERLDNAWEKELLKLKASKTPATSLPSLEIPFEQLLVYLLYRHLPQSEDETDVKAQTAFCILSYKIIRKLCIIKEREKSLTMESFLDLARLYSSEIEYSEENLDFLLDMLYRENM